MDKLPTSKKKIILLVCAFLLLFVVQVQAAPPENLNYQGKLKDSGGIPIVVPTTIQFSVYNHITNGLPTDVPSSAGPLLWTETYDQVAGDCAQVDPDAEGIFGQRLATCVVFPAYMDFTDEYYIGVKVGVDDEATPRIPLSSNPYAHTAGGLFKDGSDVNIQTENSGNVVFNSAGNVQMTSNDVTPALIINQIGIGNLFEVRDNGVTSFVILDGGNVGIGTSTPRTALELSGNGSFLATGIFDEGWTEPDLGEGTRMMWYPRRAAFRAGYVDGTQWDDGSIGDYSFAVGMNTIAEGEYSVAMGEESTASGSGAVAMGRGVIASETGSIAMGDHAEAQNIGSIAMGEYAFSSMTGSIALGYYTRATSDGATAMGYRSEATGHFSTAMGVDTVASGDYSFAIGQEIQAGANYVVAIGLDDMNDFGCNQVNSMCIMGGEVGIGTASPTASLHLNPATAARSQFRLESSAGVDPSAPNSGDMWWNGTELYFYDGTTSNDLLADASGVTTFLALTDTPVGYTAGSVLFTSGSEVTEDNTNLFWDDTSKRLGIGINTPADILHVATLTPSPRTITSENLSDGATISFGHDDFGFQSMIVDQNDNVLLGVDTLGNVGIKQNAVVVGSGRLSLKPSGGGATRPIAFDELVANGSNYVGFKAPDSITTDQVWTLPNVDGTNGQALTTDGSGILSWTTASGSSTFLALTDTPMAYTAGSLLFTSGSDVTEDNTNLFWDDGNDWLGIGTNTPSTTLHINSNAVNATALLTLANTAGDFQFFRVDATPESSVAGSIGDLTVDGTNGDLYIKASGDGTNTGWERLALASEVTGGSTSISKTAASYNGSFSSGGYVGYQAANDICNTAFPGSHFCRTDEIIQFIAEHSIAGFAGDAWIAEGPPGYTSNSNDCSGWTNSGTAQLGAYWAYDSTGGGKGWLVSCETTLPLSCCQ